MTIGNILTATGDQFLALYPVSQSSFSSLETTTNYYEERFYFLKHSLNIQQINQKKAETMGQIGVNSSMIVDKIQDIIKKFQSITPYEVIDGTFKLERRKFHSVACGLCGHKESDSYEYKLTNIKINQTITFQDSNLHAISEHQNFWYPGLFSSQNQHQISSFNICWILEFVK